MTPRYIPLHQERRRASFPNLNYTEMRKVCSSKPSQLAKKYGLEEQKTPGGSAWFKDNGASVLAIAHLDSRQPFLHFDVARLKPDTLIYCPTLDDRLGAYIILDWLQAADIKVDILLTDHEEKGRSTAGDFQFPAGKKYNWMFSFDRMGTDVVMYNYRDSLTASMLEKHGWKVGYGSYSCISELEDLGIKGFNFGTGYYNYHSEYAYASRNDIIANLRRFQNFYNEYVDVELPHEMKTSYFARDRKQGHLPFSVYNEEETYDASDIITRAEKHAKNSNKKKQTAPIYKLSRGSEDTAKASKAADLERAAKRVEKTVVMTQEEIDRRMNVINTAKKRAIATLLCQDIGLAGFDDSTKKVLYDNSICLLAELTPMSRVQFLRLDGATKAHADNIEKELGKYGLSWNTNLGDYKVTVTIIENTINNTLRKEIVNGYDNTMSTSSEKLQGSGLGDKAERFQFETKMISLPRDKVTLKKMALPLLPKASKPTENSKDVEQDQTELVLISLERDKANRYKLVADNGKLVWKENIKVGFTPQPVPSI